MSPDRIFVLFLVVGVIGILVWAEIVNRRRQSTQAGKAALSAPPPSGDQAPSGPTSSDGKPPKGVRS